MSKIILVLVGIAAGVALVLWIQRNPDLISETADGLVSSLATASPAPTVPARSGPQSSSPDELDGLQTFMLELINDDRESNGLAPLELGDNPAAQDHAEELFDQGFLGHWGLDGLKPYMRYTLAGGQGREAENVHGANGPRAPGKVYEKTPIEDSVRDAQERLMSSSGHKRTILDPWHQRVNLGIACDDVGCSVVQQFDSNYVDFARTPTIDRGVLSFKGEALEGFAYKHTQVWYDPLPQPLDPVQIRATYCYDRGEPIVFIRKPVSAGSVYATDSGDYDWPNCVSPEEVDPTEPPEKVNYVLPDESGTVPWVDADVYEVDGAEFEIEVDISEYLARFGDGVYTVVVWGVRERDSVDLSNYSIFVEDSSAALLSAPAAMGN